MRYPLYFPFPSCWLKALILEVSLIPLFIILRMVGESVFNALEVAWHSEPWRFWTWIAIAGFITPAFVLGHIYQLLWGESLKSLPKWIPSPRSWAEGIWMWIVSLIAIAIPLLGFLAIHDFNPPRTPSDIESNVMGAGILMIMAYLYHARVLIQRNFNR